MLTLRGHKCGFWEALFRKAERSTTQVRMVGGWGEGSLSKIKGVKNFLIIVKYVRMLQEMSVILSECIQKRCYC